tara:strand:- start:5452 stop:5607 length:156 start_codon:yes stop_codon:yes gene_type:complete
MGFTTEIAGTIFASQVEDLLGLTILNEPRVPMARRPGARSMRRRMRIRFAK